MSGGVDDAGRSVHLVLFCEKEIFVILIVLLIHLYLLLGSRLNS